MILVKTLLHTLWQAGGLALLLWIALRRVSTPTARYRLTLGTLAVILGTTLITWAVLNQSVSEPAAPDLASPTIPEYKPSGVSPTANFGEPSVIAYWTPIHKPAEETRWSGWLALAWLLGAALMLTRAGIQVAGAERLRRSCKPLEDSRITQLLTEAQLALNLTRRICVAVTDKLTSPAVVGVIVPTLILPLTLLTTLTPEQIRFILLHELAHIRRGDYFANLFQLFIEALLFFNPAVWWISHQVRREREACCDALAIELSGAPVDYARTLLHVAETVLNPPPAAAPAFSDNPREPSSLTDRVQRLLVPGYRPALRLTWRAMLAAIVVGGTLLFLSAVGAKSTVGAVLSPKMKTATEASNNPISSNDATKPTGILTEAQFRNALRTIERRSGLTLDNDAELKFLGDRHPQVQTPQVKNGLAGADNSKSVGMSDWEIGTHRTRISNQWFYYRVRSGHATNNLPPELQAIAEAEAISENIARLEKSIAVSKRQKSYASSEENKTLRHWIHYRVGTNLTVTAVKGRTAILKKLSEIRLENFTCDRQPLNEVLIRLSTESRLNDPNKKGIYLAVVSEKSSDVNLGEINSIPITIRPSLGKPSLWDVLTLVVKGAEKPIEFYISDDSVIFMLQSQNILRSSNHPVQVFAKTFKADPVLLAKALGMPTPPPEVVVTSTNDSAAAQDIRKTFMRIGVDLNPAQEKMFYYKPRSGAFYARATFNDLEAIENFITANCTPPPQVNIKTRFVEIPKSLFTPAWLNAASNAFLRPLTNPEVTLNMLTEAQTADVLKRIERRDGIELLCEGQVTTLTERQAQISVSEVKTIVTGISTNKSGAVVPEAHPVPLGPVIDMLPTVTSDGASIRLEVSPTIIEFVGYDTNTAQQFVPIVENGETNYTTLPLPIFHVKQITRDAIVPDRRTLILGNLTTTEIAKQPNGEMRTNNVTSIQSNLLFILITPTIIDSNGNRAK